LHIAKCTLCNALSMQSHSIPNEPRMVVPADLIGVDVASEILGISHSATVRRAKSGTIPLLALVGRSGVMVFDRSDIEAVK